MTEEEIDVLNPDGTPAGIRKRKSEIHRDGDWHRAAHVWVVVGDGRLLLQRRSHSKENWPGQWDISAAGHVSAGETSVEAAVREMEEELGLRIAPSDLQPIATLRESCVLRGGTYIDNEIHDVFLVRRDVDLAALVFNDGEVEDVALVERGELLTRDDLVPHPEEYALIWSAAATPPL